MRKNMIVDAQVHLWKEETPDRPWPVWGRAALHMPHPLTYQRMLGLMDEAGVDRVIAIPPSWEGDRIDYALEAAQSHPDRFAVMGRIALNDPSNAKRLPRWREQKGMLGLRVTFTHGRDSWISDGTAEWVWGAAEEANIPLMVHVPDMIPQITKVAEKYPRLKLIIDHFGISRVIAKEGRIEEAISQVVSLARFPNVHVKTSSAPTYSSGSYPFRDMYPHVKRIVEAFGPRRCFWGTDVSISFNKCTYQQRITHFTEELDFLSTEDKEWIMGRGILECLAWPA